VAMLAKPKEVAGFIASAASLKQAPEVASK
jgi:hypothetical protein